MHIYKAHYWSLSLESSFTSSSGAQALSCVTDIAAICWSVPGFSVNDVRFYSLSFFFFFTLYTVSPAAELNPQLWRISLSEPHAWHPVLRYCNRCWFCSVSACDRSSSFLRLFVCLSFVGTTSQTSLLWRMNLFGAHSWLMFRHIRQITRSQRKSVRRLLGALTGYQSVSR